MSQFNHVDPVTTEYAALGRFGAVHGVQGWIKLFSFTEPKSRLFAEHSQFYISNDERQWKEIEIEAHRAFKDDFLVKVKGVDSPEAARVFTHSYLGVQAQDLPSLAEGEYYWRDLVGLEVYNHRNECLGQVDYLIETGSNDVLVTNSKPPVAIPYLFHTVIQSIDLQTKRIDVNWEQD